jgi:hypothetical protein
MFVYPSTRPLQQRGGQRTGPFGKIHEVWMIIVDVMWSSDGQSIEFPLYFAIYLYMALESFVWPWQLLTFLIFFTVDRTLGRGISPSQDSNLHTGQHKYRIKAHRHPYLEWNRTRNPIVWEAENSSCLRPHGHSSYYAIQMYFVIFLTFLWQMTDVSSCQRGRSTPASLQMSYSNKDMVLNPKCLPNSKTD